MTPDMPSSDVTEPRNDYDVLIIGGGLVGAGLARALAPLPLRIALVDNQVLEQRLRPGFDVRALALSFGSRRILEGLGVWSTVAATACPIEHIHVSDRGHFGITRLHAKDYGVPALGYVCAADDLGRALGEHITGQDNLDLHIPARVHSIAVDQDWASIRLEGRPDPLRARLVVAADGSDSAVREALAIPTRVWRYGQTAVIATVRPQRPHHQVAYERFTDSGPMALLPLPDRRCSLVWTVRDADSEALTGLDDPTFLRRLGERFGTRLGRFEQVGRRYAYPLKQRFAQRGVASRVALLGNAAHTLHPVAGQGLNLGLRDVAVLAELLAACGHAGAPHFAPTHFDPPNFDPPNFDPGDFNLLHNYQARRSPDQRRTALATDGLARLFTNPLLPLQLARNSALGLLDITPPLKRRLAVAAMGLSGPQPRLSLGLPLRL